MWTCRWHINSILFFCSSLCMCLCPCPSLSDMSLHKQWYPPPLVTLQTLIHKPALHNALWKIVKILQLNVNCCPAVMTMDFLHSKFDICIIHFTQATSPFDVSIVVLLSFIFVASFTDGRAWISNDIADFSAGVAILKESANTGCFCRSNRHIWFARGRCMHDRNFSAIGPGGGSDLSWFQCWCDTITSPKLVCGFTTLLLCSLIDILVSLFLQY